MRQLSATTDRVQFTLGSTLNVGAFLDFTVSFFWRPDSLGGSLGDIWTAGKSGGNRFGCTWEESSDRIAFKSVGHSGTDPFTSSGIQLVAADITNGGVWAAYRYSAAEWSKWMNGTKTVINASIAFSLAQAMTDVFVGRNTYATTNAAVGRVGELAIWTQALTDQQMVDLSRGVAADQIALGALVFYAPLRGTFGTQRELFYAGDVSSVSMSATTQAAHPDIIAYPAQPKYEPAWAVDLFHADGTVKMASRDLFENVDVDILGDFYPGDIRSPESIEVRDELSDGFYGVQVPQSVVILTKPGPSYRDVVMEDVPVGYWRLSEAAFAAAADETANNLDGAYTGGFTYDMRGGVRSFDADGRAVRFNGSTGYVNVPDNALLDVVAALTLEAWIWVDSYSNYWIIAAKTTGNAGPMPFEWRLEQTTGKPQLVHHFGVVHTATNPVPLNSWHHVAITRAGGSGSVITHYLDGIQNGSGTLGGTIAASATAMKIGARDDLFSFWPGAMQHVAIYDHVLSEDRIRLRYRVGLQTWKGKIGHVREWRGVRARLRRYDHATHELTNELQGVVADVDHAGTAITITTDDAVLSTPIPRQTVNINDFPSGTDLGACIPVIMGAEAFLAPPYCGRDDEPEGRDFLLGWQYSANALLMPIRLLTIWEDIQTDPGLELLTEWVEVSTEFSTTVAFVSSTKFSVNKDLKYIFPPGLPVRYKDTAGGANWQYTHVSSYDTAPSPDQVTVADAELDSGLNSVQIQAAGYLLEKARYSLLSEDLVSIRRFDGSSGSPVVRASNTYLGNPATVVDEILRNTKWGLGQTVNAASVATAEAALTAAGLGAAVVGCLGWNKQQRRADDVLKDLLAMYGGRLSRDASTGEWLVRYDAAPSVATLTLGFGDGQWNNVSAVRSVRRRSLAEAVQTVRFRFGLKATASAADGLRGAISLVPERYQFYVDADGLDVGKTIEITNPYIANASIARRVAYYRAQSLRASDLGIEIEGGMEMRFIRAGDLVRFVDPVHGFDATYRVWGVTKRLHQVSAQLRSYDAAVYTYDASKISVDTTDVTDLDERATLPGTGMNLILNPDFSAGFNKQNIATPEAMPGWSAIYTGSDLTSLATTSDGDTISGASYVTAVVASVVAGTSPILEARRIAINADDVGRQLIASVYSDRADGWRFIFFFDGGPHATAVTEPSTRIAGGANPKNGKGWRRYYAMSQVPVGATELNLWIIMDRATGTYKFDGVQLEYAGRRSHRPTEWKRHPRFGIDPAQLQPGDMTIRPGGQPEAGLRIVNVIEDVSTFGTGTTKDSSAALFPAGCMPIFLAGRVTTSVAGTLASIAVGLAADTQRFAPNGTSKAAGTTWTVANHNGSHVPLAVYAANTAVRISAIGGNFSGAGVVRLHACYALSIAPTQ